MGEIGIIMSVKSMLLDKILYMINIDLGNNGNEEQRTKQEVDYPRVIEL